jgi:NAD(P)-dependent dehydrogenase (short-subunit alcohol dehydrogenase family)
MSKKHPLLAEEEEYFYLTSPFIEPDGFIDQTDIRTSAVTQVGHTRAGKPEEVAHDVHILASPEYSFVTAQCYDVCGGRATY